MPAELLERVQQTVEVGKQAGADDVFASLSRSRTVEFSWRDGALEKVKDTTSRSLVVRLFVQGRYSSHTTTDLAPDRVTAFVGQALALTRALESDRHRTITPPALYAGRTGRDLELLDPGVQAISRDQRLAWCETLDAVAHGHSRVISATAVVSDAHSQEAAASSNGFSAVSAASLCWLGSQVTLRDQAQRRAEASFYAGARHLSDLPDAEQVARQALGRAVLRLGADKGPTQRTNMVVDPSAATALVSRLLSAATAQSVQQGQSFWADLLGQPGFSHKLTLLDNPLRVRGLASRYYDTEGIAAKPFTLVENGTVRQLYVDPYYGRKIGLPPTTGSPSNREVRLGQRGLDQIVSDVGSGVYITSWLGGNANPTSGDFSFGLRGHLIENGMIGRPIREMNVTGNLRQLFQNIAEIGNDPWPYSPVRAPTLVFEDVQFSGT